MVALRYAARSHLGLGTKSRNEDSAYAGPELLVLCDGMGGHAAGDVASSLVVGELVHLDGESHGADDMSSILEQAMIDANDRLGEVAEKSESTEGMGTTCIAMMRSGTKLAVANIGDSRAYLRRGVRVTQITKDHSFVQQLLDEGRISEEEALHHPQRSLVTRVFTGRPDDRPDLSMRELRPGDRLLLCSDGLTDYVAESTVAELLRSEEPPGKVADQLIAIALRASTRDNVTVIVADVTDAGAGGTTEPQVVGAASERRGTEMLSPQTPAEKAAALSRTVHGTDPAPELAEETSRGGLATWLRRSLVGLAILAVVAVGGWLTYDWSQRQYFVGEANGNVTIFRGVSQNLGPLVLSTPEEETDVALETLPSHYRNRVINTLTADDRADADRIVDELRGLALPRCEDVIVLPQPGDGSSSTAGPDDATSTTGPDGAVSTIGPDGASQTAGPDDALRTMGPDGASTTAGPDDASATSLGPDGAAATGGLEASARAGVDATAPTGAATDGPSGPTITPAVDCVP
ncbi:serine/threonine-protein phosphatase [Ornithinimicrobium ciconiae]|uniref:Serine/threonine-protein phosphatase n=1 Tax=Ornithinimicrobium ciconiae TaxID=2594265 RepID=A0A516G6M1_9MICO|nr:protein phosphatase 2C domain-containing protein [Ornithinimicrobium ciconiae]QDO87174.1 serine/threonine-protein phosphatase [Ornithinimicrobium ciconiae]